MLSRPSALVILIEAEFEIVKPLELFLLVIPSLFSCNNPFEYDASVLVKLVSPVSKFHPREIHQVLWLGELRERRYNSGGAFILSGQHCETVENV